MKVEKSVITERGCKKCVWFDKENCYVSPFEGCIKNKISVWNY